MASTWQKLAYVTNGSSTSTTMLDTANDSSFSGDDFAEKKYLKILLFKLLKLADYQHFKNTLNQNKD